VIIRYPAVASLPLHNHDTHQTIDTLRCMTNEISKSAGRADAPSKSEWRLNLAELITWRADRNPQRPFIVMSGQTAATLGDLRDQVQSTVSLLEKLGYDQTCRIAVVLPNGPEMAMCTFSLCAGTTCAPLNPNGREREYRSVLHRLRADAVVLMEGEDGPARRAAHALQIPVLALSQTDGPAGGFEIQGQARDSAVVHDGESRPWDDVLILPTSGTTSRPRLVPLTHANVCHAAWNIADAIRLVEQDCCLNVMPLFNIHGLSTLFSSLVSGGSVVCTSGFDPKQFLNWLEEFQPTWYTAAPTIHQSVLSECRDRELLSVRSSLRLIRSASSGLPVPIQQELERVFSVPVIQSYGMTEAAPQISSNLLPRQQRKPGTVGLPAGPEIGIMNDRGSLLAQGHVGEVVIRGANVTHGYCDDPDGNASAFRCGWFRTGDVGRFDEDGFLSIVGRVREIINRGGAKVSPQEVDDVLLQHPEVAEVAAFGVPHPTLGEDVAVAIVPRNGSWLTEHAVRTHAAQQLAEFKLPSQVLFVDRIPKGPTGKLRRVELARHFGLSMKNGDAPSAPACGADSEMCDHGTIVYRLGEIWCDLLHRDRVGIHDNFFAMGGDSLSAASLFTQLEREFGRILALQTLFEAPTIAELGKRLGPESWPSPASPLVPMQPNGMRRPFFIVHPIGGNLLAYSDLVRRLGPDQPIYGLQPIGLDGQQEPLEDVSRMAALYVKSVIAAQPEGPYRLGGASMGGDLAYEMARQLDEAGHKVSLLALFDVWGPLNRE